MLMNVGPSPVIDYQRILRGESVLQNVKNSKSYLGYYSQQNTPNNFTVRQQYPSSKSPDIASQILTPLQANHQKNSYSQNQSNGNLMSQSAQSNYPNAAIIMNQFVNKQSGAAGKQVRSGSRKKQKASGKSSFAVQPQIGFSNRMIENNMRANSNTQKNTLEYENNSNNILNDSNNFMLEEPFQSKQYQSNNTYKQSSQFASNNASQNDESYVDATAIYDQFIQGPHNLSQIQEDMGRDKAFQMYTYSQQLQRPSSQLSKKKKFVRQSPNQLKISQNTRSGNQQNFKSQRVSTYQNTGMNQANNSSGQKSQKRRMLMGRTPSPNFIKRIAGIMNFGHGGLGDNVYLQNLMKENDIKSHTSKNEQQRLNQSSSTVKRPSIQLQLQHTAGGKSGQLISGFSSNTSSFNTGNTTKQKFIKQYGASSKQFSFKSGAMTTSNNTAKNSPKMNSSIRHINKNALINQMSQNSIYDPQLVQQQQQEQPQQMFHKKQLKEINNLEEQKALALVSNLTSNPKNINDPNIKQYQMNFQQPKQVIGELIEEEPQALSFHEFVNLNDIKIPQNDKNQTRKQSSQGALNQKSEKSTIQQILDGGTGSNGIIAANLIQSQNSSLGQFSEIKYHYQEKQSQVMDKFVANKHHGMKQSQQFGKDILDNQQLISQIVNQNDPSSSNVRKSSPCIAMEKRKDLILRQLTNDQKSDMISSSAVEEPLFKKRSEVRKFEINEERSIERPQSVLSSNQNYSRKKTASVDIQNSNGNNQSLKQEKIQLSEYNYQQIDIQNNAGKQKPISLQKKILDFDSKTPFEQELEEKSKELQSKKNTPMSKNHEDSLSILKQLQKSSNLKEYKQLISSDQNQLEIMHINQANQIGNIGQVRLQEEGISGAEMGRIMSVGQSVKQSLVGGKGGQSNVFVLDNDLQSVHTGGAFNRKQSDIVAKLPQQVHHQPLKLIPSIQNLHEDELNAINKAIDDEPVLMTQEDEEQIRNIASDINEKAFYGKLLRHTKPMEYDASLVGLSPRSREIAQMTKKIKESFKSQECAPVTTTEFYRIGKMLGRGAFGKVNLAMHKLVRKLVAIKSLNKDCLTDEAQKAKLMKEVNLLLKLRHNHVVKIYETIETDKHIIIVMELCAGGDLLNYVRKRRRLKEPFAKLIFKQIIDGLCYIHSKYIAHRDIKLDNILLDGKGNVKIADFGVSKQCQKGQKMTEQCGTPAYIAPEILRDKGYSFNVDLWSAGVVLFAMLYGTVPFKANNMEELHKLITKGKYTLKDDISMEARNLLRGLLEVNPEKRLTIKQIYRHKWLQDIDPSLQLFNDSERDMIRKEYTYNDPRRYNRNENEEPVDCFTEHNLESVYNSLKNATSKSVILAPFNSTQSQIDSSLRMSIKDLIAEKMIILKFARRCREIDRQYEFNNNGDLDNGVYHKCVYNNSDEEDREDQKQDNNCKELNEPMLVNPKEKNSQNSFENISKDNQKLVGGGDLKRNRRKSSGGDLDLNEELVKTYETYQSNFGLVIDDEKIQNLMQYGYPQSYILKTLQDNDPNYCTAGYYLLGMDQNYC